MPEATRPLTKHENQIRLLYEYADELIGQMGIIRESVGKLDRLEVLINGVEGAPGLVEILEWMSFEISRIEQFDMSFSVREVKGLDERLNRIESLIKKIIDDGEHARSRGIVAINQVLVAAAFSCGLIAINALVFFLVYLGKG